MPSKQTESNRRHSLERLKGMIPSACPLLVRREDPQFVVTPIGANEEFSARYFLVVASYIKGFVEGWKRRD